ncbi:MAG: DUF2510 domain-containing protein [Aquihabitans sp.]
MTAPQAAQPLPSDQAVIEVTTSHFFLAFILSFCKVFVALNGQAAEQRWGSVTIPVAPGRYTVEAWTRYVKPEMGRSGVVVDAAPGTITRVRWKAPWLIFLQGKIQVTGVEAFTPGSAPVAPAPAVAAPPAPVTAPPAPPAPAAAAPGGWHPDPSGRHEHRFHDGQNWTEHVSTAGVAGTDPVGPA